MPSSKPPASPGIRVLLVEDEVAIRRATTATLETMGYAVDSAPELDAATALLGQNTYDLALVDLNLRQSQSGFVLIRTIRAKGLSIPIVVLSSTRDHEDILAAFRLGAANFVRKPVRVSELAVVIRAILRGQGVAEAGSEGATADVADPGTHAEAAAEDSPAGGASGATAAEGPEDGGAAQGPKDPGTAEGSSDQGAAEGPGDEGEPESSAPDTPGEASPVEGAA